MLANASIHLFIFVYPPPCPCGTTGVLQCPSCSHDPRVLELMFYWIWADHPFPRMVCRACMTFFPSFFNHILEPPKINPNLILKLKFTKRAPKPFQNKFPGTSTTLFSSIPGILHFDATLSYNCCFCLSRYSKFVSRCCKKTTGDGLPTKTVPT